MKAFRSLRLRKISWVFFSLGMIHACPGRFADAALLPQGYLLTAFHLPARISLLLREPSLSTSRDLSHWAARQAQAPIAQGSVERAIAREIRGYLAVSRSA